MGNGFVADRSVFDPFAKVPLPETIGNLTMPSVVPLPFDGEITQLWQTVAKSHTSANQSFHHNLSQNKFWREGSK